MSSYVRNAPFSPFVTGGALLLLTKAPASIRDPILVRLRELLSAQNISRLVTALKWFFAAGVLNNANSVLNELAHNNFYLTSSRKDWDWPNEIAVVTGASSGFGKLFSQDLAAKGIKVAALDINSLPADLASNPRVTFFKCDVTDPEAVKAVGKEVQATLGDPSILINNAGIGALRSILDSDPKGLHKIFDVNLISHYYLYQAFVPAMIKAKKGHVVTLASMASFVSGPGFVDYSCTKAGALALHDGLASELRAFHNCPQIKMTIVHPGWADTPLIAKEVEHLRRVSSVLDPQEVSDAVVKQILSCRGGQLIMMAGGRVSSTLRSWPFWLQRIAQGQLEKDTLSSTKLS